MFKFVSSMWHSHPVLTALAVLLPTIYICNRVFTHRKSFKGKIVLVTGGGSGIGKLMCKLFAEDGARVAIWDINEKAAADVAKELRAKGGDVRSYMCDVSSPESVYAVAKQVKEELGAPDVVVNNAGVVSGAFITDLTERAINRTFGVNVLAHFWIAKAFLPDMIKRKTGHIVNVASAAGWVGTAKMTDYSGSKWAAIGASEALRYELQARGLDDIHVTTVCPYYINTGMFEGVQSSPLLPILDENYVAEQTIEAIRTNRAVLNMPWLVNTVPLFRMLPQWLMDAGIGFFRLNRAMENFHGRSVLATSATSASTSSTSSASAPSTSS